MEHLNFDFWRVISYILGIAILSVFSILIWGWLSSIGMDSCSTLIGALFGIIDGFVPLLLALLVSLINKTFGKVSAIFLLILQASIIVACIVKMPFTEIIETGFYFAQIILYAGGLIVGVVEWGKRKF